MKKVITQDFLQSQIDCLIHDRHTGKLNGVKYNIDDISVKISKDIIINFRMSLSKDGLQSSVKGEVRVFITNSCSSFDQDFYFSSVNINVSEVSTSDSWQKPTGIEKFLLKIINSKKVLSNKEFTRKTSENILYPLFSNLPLYKTKTEPNLHLDEGSTKIEDSKIILTIPCLYPESGGGLHVVM